MSNELVWVRKGGIEEANASGFTYRCCEPSDCENLFIVQDRTGFVMSRFQISLNDCKEASRLHHNAILATIEDSKPRWVNEEILTWEGYTFKVIAAPKLHIVPPSPEKEQVI